MQEGTVGPKLWVRLLREFSGSKLPDPTKYFPSMAATRPRIKLCKLKRVRCCFCLCASSLDFIGFCRRVFTEVTYALIFILQESLTRLRNFRSRTILRRSLRMVIIMRKSPWSSWILFYPQEAPTYWSRSVRRQTISMTLCVATTRGRFHLDITTNSYPSWVDT